MPGPFALTVASPAAFELVTEAAGTVPIIPQSLTGAQGSAALAPQPANLQGTLLVDPQNSTGVATATGANVATVNGFTGPVFSSYLALVQAWGTYYPLLTLNTTIVFVSSHTDNTDPVPWSPLVARGANVVLRTSGPQVVTAGVVLAGTTAKSRAAGANSPLITTLGGTAVVGQLVQNATHPSNAWANKSLGAGSFRMTNPAVAATIGGTLAPAEVDTWANGDSVNLVQPISVNLVLVAPTILDGLGSVSVYQVNGFSPTGVASSILTVNALAGNCTFIECNFQRILNLTASTILATTFVNCQFLGGIAATGRTTFNLGGLGATAPAFTLTNIGDNNSVVDGDFILSSSSTMLLNGGQVNFGQVFFDQNITVGDSVLGFVTGSYGGHTLYSIAGDAHTINFVGTAHGFNASGTFAAALTAPGLIAGIKLNGAATGSSHTGASPDVLNSAIAVTPANLDAAAGVAGFGGNAFNLGGASISNVN